MRNLQQKKKRLGRGEGSGTGGTSGRGHKGQSARSGGIKVSFEGGQTSLFLSTRKKGFNNYNSQKRKHITTKTTDELFYFLESMETKIEVLKKDMVNGFFLKNNDKIKLILGRQKLIQMDF